MKVASHCLRISRLPDFRAFFVGFTDAFGFFQAVIQHPWHIVSNDELLSALRTGAQPKLDRIHHGRDDQRRNAVRAVDLNFGEFGICWFVLRRARASPVRQMRRDRIA